MKQNGARPLGGGETMTGPGGQSNNVHILRSKGSKWMENLSRDGKVIRFEFLKDRSKCSMKNKLKMGNTECGEDPLRSYSTN